MTSTEPRTSPVSRARVALIAGAFYILILAVLHIARPDVSPLWQTTSEFARGSGGWAMVVAFLASATALFALALALLPVLRSVPGRIGIAILLLVCVGTALGGLFVTDPIETAQADMTMSGTVHGLSAGLALTLTPIAALIVNIALARRAPTRSTRNVLLVLAPVPFIALAVFMAVQSMELPADGTFGPDVHIGPAERILVVAYALWQIATAALLARKAGWLTAPAR